jgi:hypothetical protein
MTSRLIFDKIQRDVISFSGEIITADPHSDGNNAAAAAAEL